MRPLDRSEISVQLAVTEQHADEYDTTVARVIRLLPRPPEKVVVIDADTSGQSLHDKLQHAEGFVNPGRRFVYLVRQSDTCGSGSRGFEPRPSAVSS